MPDRTTPGSPDGNQRAHAEKRVFALACVLVAVTAAAYCGTFGAPTHFDDDASLSENPSIRHFSTALFPPATPTVGGRPVLNLSFAVSYALSGDKVWAYHALNLLIHVLAALVLFGIARRTPQGGLGRTLTAFFIALIWAVHPLQTESVTYIVQRAESLMGLFFLLTLYCFIRGSEPAERSPVAWLALSAAACLLGMGTKEVMVSAPIVVLLYDRTFVSGSFRDALLRRREYYAGLAATWIFLPFLVLSTHGRGGTAGFASGVSWWRYLLTQVHAIPHYLRLAVWPRPLVFDYGTSVEPVSAALLLPGALLVGLAAATIWASVHKRAAGFLGAAFFMVLAPSSSVVPVASEPMAEHRMYLPLAAVAALAVAWLAGRAGRAAVPVLALLSVALFGATVARNRLYLSDLSLWRDTAEKMPFSYRAHNNLGGALDNDGLPAEAIAEYEESLRLNPGLAEAHANLATDLAKIPGREAEAMAQFEEAIRVNPGYEPAHKNLANLLEDQGRTAEAIAQSEEALRLRPGDAQAHSNLGSALASAGRLTEGIAQCRMAVALEPGLAEAHSNLGGALTRVPGEAEEAAAECREAVRLKPGDAKAHNNLGSALVHLPGRLQEAASEYAEAVRLNPSLAEARNNLGNALNAEGRSREAIEQFREALRLRPGFAEAHSNLGNALATTPGGMEEAILQYREALRLRPDYVSALNNLGSALNAVGRTAEAVEQFEAAVRLAPDVPAVRLNLGLALLRLGGRGGDAAAQFREVLRLQPDNPVARQCLAQIESTGH